jgi:hypothetical protein
MAGASATILGIALSFYNGDWLKRAAGAQAGIYGNESIEAAYPIAKTMADGDEEKTMNWWVCLRMVKYVEDA